MSYFEVIFHLCRLPVFHTFRWNPGEVHIHLKETKISFRSHKMTFATIHRVCPTSFLECQEPFIVCYYLW